MNPTSFSPLTRRPILLFSQRPMANPRSRPPSRSQTESLLSTKSCPTRCRGSNVEPNCQFMISGHSLAQSVHTLLHIFCLQKQAQMYTNTHAHTHSCCEDHFYYQEGLHLLIYQEVTRNRAESKFLHFSIHGAVFSSFYIITVESKITSSLWATISYSDLYLSYFLLVRFPVMITVKSNLHSGLFTEIHRSHQHTQIIEIMGRQKWWRAKAARMRRNVMLQSTVELLRWQ